MQVNMHEAKTQLSRLGELAWQGEEIVIAKAGKPYLDLVPHREPKTGDRKLGLLKGQIWTAPDFDETPAEVIDAFEGIERIVQRLLLDTHVLLWALEDSPELKENARKAVMSTHATRSS